MTRLARIANTLANTTAVLALVSFVGFLVGLNVPGWPEILIVACAGMGLAVLPLAVAAMCAYAIETLCRRSSYR